MRTTQLLILKHFVLTSLSVALAVFTRSPAAYDALKSFKLLQLPSRRTLKDYIDAYLEGGGECLERLEEERKQYLEMVDKKEEENEAKKLSKLMHVTYMLLVCFFINYVMYLHVHVCSNI